MPTRKEIWNRLANDFKPESFEPFIQQEISLQQLPEAITLLKGQARGRTIVKL